MNWWKKIKFKKNILDFTKNITSFPNNWISMINDETLWDSFFTCLFSHVDMEIKKSRGSVEHSNLYCISDILKAYVHNSISIGNYELAFNLIKHYYKEWYRKER